MTRIVPFTGAEPQKYNKKTKQERVEQREAVATGAGGVAAGVTATKAAKLAKTGARSDKTLRAAENGLQQMSANVTRITRSVNQNTEVATTLLGKFKSNIKFYTKDIMDRIGNLKGAKIFEVIKKSPITRTVAGVLGAGLAFFVLVTGINKAFKTGAVAVNDFKNQYNDFKA